MTVGGHQPYSTSADTAQTMLGQLRNREFERLLTQARSIVGGDAEHAEPVDPGRHLVVVGEYRREDPVRRPIPLEAAAAELVRALDEPAADPGGSLRRALTIQTLRELVVRLLVADMRGEMRADTAYARAVSDLAVDLSLDTGDDGD